MRKATIRFFRPVCSSIRMDHFGSKWKDFREILFGEFLTNSVSSVQLWLK